MKDDRKYKIYISNIEFEVSKEEYTKHHKIKEHMKYLTTQEYCGDVINFKTFSKTYKNKKRYKNDEENIVVLKKIHTPIIERSVFEKIQEKRGEVRKRKKAYTENA